MISKIQLIVENLRLLNRRRLNARRGRKAAAEISMSAYEQWIAQYDTIDLTVRQALIERLNKLKSRPQIAIVMPVFNPDVTWLGEAIASVQNQIYPHWELCIADDASTDDRVHELLRHVAANDSRIKVEFKKENGHISDASNSALAMVGAPYVGFLDHDDVLREHALLLVAESINRWPGAKLIYSDEDKISQDGIRCEPHFKPDWNPELLLVQNYICHFVVLYADIIRDAGGLRQGYEGAQDHDMLLRCSRAIEPENIIHVPHILYHWRQHVGSTSLNASGSKSYADEARSRAIDDHLATLKISAEVELDAYGWGRLKWRDGENPPLVSIIIPTRNGLAVLRKCIDSLLCRTSYKNYEILIVDNGSDDFETLKYLDEISKNAVISIIRDDSPFNYSALNNLAAAVARGEYLALLNNDVEVINNDWLNELVSLAAMPNIGAVGARLYYDNKTLQHAGVFLGIGGVAGHAHKYMQGENPGYMGRAQLLQSMSAVTGACLVVKKSAFDAVGGLDEGAFAVAFNDVDFCLRLIHAGYRNVWTPHAELFHYESISRGSDDTPEKRQRFNLEVAAMHERWGELLKWDPAYNPNLTLQHEDLGLAFPPRVALTKPWFEGLPNFKSICKFDYLDKYKTVIDLNEKNDSHTQIVEHIKGTGRRYLRVLDVGCASGDLGGVLSAGGHHVTGIEPSAIAAASAHKKLDSVFLGRFDQYPEIPNIDRFDAVILADVLEHTATPESILVRLRSMLSPSGFLVISIPNITHASVRAMLFDGKWRYSSKGILDETHLRFYSRESFVDLLTRCGLNIERMSVTTADARSVGRQFDMGLSERGIAWAELTSEGRDSAVVQYIVTATFGMDSAVNDRLNERWRGDFEGLQLENVKDVFFGSERDPSAVAVVKDEINQWFAVDATENRTAST